MGRAEPGARHAAQRADRPPPPVRDRALRAVRLQARQERVRRHGQRRRARDGGGRPAPLAAVARRAHGGPRAARARPGLDPRGRRARRTPATGSPSCAGRCPSTSRTRSPAWRPCGRRWTGSRSPSRRSAPRCSTSVQNLAPPTVLAQASRMNFSTRLFNLLVTNVPGPQFPLYALGRELEELFPVAFLPGQPRARRRDHLLQRRHRLRAARRLRRDARPRAVRRPPRRMRGRSWWTSRRRRRRTASAPSSPRRTSRPRTSSPASTEA